MKRATKARDDGRRMTDGPFAVAEELLLDLGRLTRTLEEKERIAAEEIERVAAMHQGLIENFRERVGAREKELLAHMKAHKIVLFDHTDQVDLVNGILLRGEEDKVKIPKTAVAELEKLGWEDGLKRTVAADRETIGKWPVERLAAIGASLKMVEIFSYELKEISRRGAEAQRNER